MHEQGVFNIILQQKTLVYHIQFSKALWTIVLYVLWPYFIDLKKYFLSNLFSKAQTWIAVNAVFKH